MATSEGTVPRRAGDEPEPRAALRGLGAYAAIVGGAVLMAVGWYGISGTAVVARQLPYLASATLPGLALVVSGAVLVSGDRTRRSNQRAADMVATLYRLLTEAVEQPDADADSVGPDDGRRPEGSLTDRPERPD